MTCRSAHHRATNDSLSTLQNNMKEIRRGQVVYNTPELDSHLKDISNGVDQIRLNNIFSTGSNSWKNPYSSHDSTTKERLLAEQQRNAINVSRNFFDHYKKAMNNGNIQAMYGNQIREQHHWANQNLQTLKYELEPTFAFSRLKVDQFCDNMGVTDRYLGYRNNLNRKLQPGYKNGIKCAAEQVPDRSAICPPRFHLSRGVSAPVGLQVQGYNSTRQCSRFCKQQTPQEAAGINMIYPGTTEYYDHYQRPATSMVTGREYTINPCPDLSKFGKIAVPESYEVNSEYNHKYEWPNGEKLNVLPWRSVHQKPID